jgi:glycosyltransferase involved in cell wall biosynthesis
MSLNKRYRWVGALPHWKTRKLIAGSHLLLITSRIEGSSNALAEALVSGVPVVASRIPGVMGTLGADYPGYFPVGDAERLSRLILKAETEDQFYAELKSRCAEAARLVSREQEVESWERLLGEVAQRES